MVWARDRAMGLGLRLGLGLHGSSMALLAVRQFDGSSSCTAIRRQFYRAFTIYTCLNACELRDRYIVPLVSVFCGSGLRSS